jgi:hypothetical protein
MTTATKAKAKATHKPVEQKVTAYSIIAVIKAIKGNGPRVDRETYKAHVPNFVTKTGEFGPLLEQYPDARLTVEAAIKEMDAKAKPAKAAKPNTKKPATTTNIDPYKIGTLINKNPNELGSKNKSLLKKRAFPNASQPQKIKLSTGQVNYETITVAPTVSVLEVMEAIYKFYQQPITSQQRKTLLKKYQSKPMKKEELIGDHVFFESFDPIEENSWEVWCGS